MGFDEKDTVTTVEVETKFIQLRMERTGPGLPDVYVVLTVNGNAEHRLVSKEGLAAAWNPSVTAFAFACYEDVTTNWPRSVPVPEPDA